MRIYNRFIEWLVKRQLKKAGLDFDYLLTMKKKEWELIIPKRSDGFMKRCSVCKAELTDRTKKYCSICEWDRGENLDDEYMGGKV